MEESRITGFFVYPAGCFQAINRTAARMLLLVEFGQKKKNHKLVGVR